MTTVIKPLVVPAVSKHTATVIMAHGLGDSGAGWISLAQNFRARSKFDEVKFIFPNAPSIPITVNMGMQMPGWYDIFNFGDIAGRMDEVGIMRSHKYFHELIAQEIEAGIPSERIVLGGFSQGGAMSLFAGVTNPTKLGGIFGLSCYMLMHNTLKEYIPKDEPNMDTPIFMGHGAVDPLVKPQYGALTAKILSDLGYKVELKMYPGLAHSADQQEMDDLEAYLKEQLPELPDKAKA